MKWLILAPSSDNAEKFVGFLETKKCESSVFGIDCEYKDLFAAIKSADNFIVCDTEKLAENPKFSFIYGLIAERGQFVIVQGKNVDSLNDFVCGCDNIVFAQTKADGLKILRSNFKTYFDVDTQNNARRELLSRGLPFTADCMAHFIEKDKPEIVDLVYTAGLDVNSFTEDGVPVLCAATRCGNVEYVKWLLKKNADVNIISKDRGYSPVMDAVWKKNLDMVKLFIKCGADLGVMSSDGQPILVLAVGNGNAKIVETLLKAGADPDVKDSMGMSARNYASLFKNTELVKLMNKFPKKEQ
ncbi:MAG: ankyrin repeat domain-containing protein [Treponema sp.]|nr:ankyrin repeat domain-containing protein [Candidatus Treponema equi]